MARKGDAKEVIKGLEEQTRAISANVRRLEAKVARQSWSLEPGGAAHHQSGPPDAEAAGSGATGGRGEDEGQKYSIHHFLI